MTQERQILEAAEPPVPVVLTRADAQLLYDHTGTMPWAYGSWSNNVRAVLSEALATTPHRFVSVNLAEAEEAIRAKAGATTNPEYGRRLNKFLGLLDWARSDG